VLVENHTTEGEELLSYVVASGDMRFIGIAERSLFLRHDPELGQVIRGEVLECGPECNVNLSHILLEYVMSHEDRSEVKVAAEAADHFGQQLGQELIDLYDQEPADKPGIQALADSVTIVLNSMDVPMEFVQSGNLLRYTLAYCPLHATADKAGLNLWVALAHRSLIALIETLVHGLAPGWTLQSPAERESDMPLREILFARL
jgi:hypothetical protein